MTSIPKEDERTPGPMKYWFDTEFVEDGRTIDLMSIGVVAEDGREYYAEIEECDLSRADDWVKANVIVHLTGEKKPRAVVRDELLAFMGKKPEIWAYYADYDWIALCQLFGRMIDLPDGWPMFCRDLKQLAGDTPLIKQEGTEHHALADARWTREAWLALNGSFNSLREALANLVNAKALSGVRSLVAGWNGEDKPERYERHPSRLGARIETTCGRIYELDELLTAARAALSGVSRYDNISGKQAANSPDVTEPAHGGVPDNDRHHSKNDNERLREIEAAARAYMNAVEREVIPEGDMLTTTTWHRLTDALSGVTQPATSTAANDVLAERERQKSVEGWTPEHDDTHTRGEMAVAAACYAAPRSVMMTGSIKAIKDNAFRLIWPWSPVWWKPRNTRRNLVRAAALLIAEIERLDRAEVEKISTDTDAVLK